MGCRLWTGARGRVGRNSFGWNALLEKHRWHLENAPWRALDEVKDCAIAYSQLGGVAIYCVDKGAGKK
jgi:hypothetical protein